MNVNFFICENSFIIICFVWGLSFWFLVLFFFPFVRRESDGCYGRCGAALSVSGLEVSARLSLSRLFCLTSFFSFKIGILHVEPAIEDSEN